LQYNYGSNKLSGLPNSEGILTIQAVGDGGVIQEQFDLTVRNGEMEVGDDREENGEIEMMAESSSRMPV